MGHPTAPQVRDFGIRKSTEIADEENLRDAFNEEVDERK